MATEISIIIVAYNRLDLVKVCLARVRKFMPSKAEVVFVDNGSTEDVFGFAKREFPEFRLVKTRSNLGFAKGYNLGMRRSHGKYLLLLNTDAFLESKVIEELLAFLQNHPGAGVVAPRLCNIDGSIQPSAGHFANLPQIFLMMTFIDNLPIVRMVAPSIHVRYLPAFSEVRTFDWVAGACLLIPREVFQKTGGFDERIFMYGEEVEWLYRINKAGWKIYYDPKTKVAHVGFASSDEASGAVKEMESFIFFYRKHKPQWQLPILVGLLVVGCLLRVFRGILFPKKRWMVKAYLVALKEVLRHAFR
ncbi:MAG: glycosyltransferase family 2 protein [Patescibacteria group bacterium]|nr:glycosyltransferase family 2 protein [Patescibacteria group bacterium]